MKPIEPGCLALYTGGVVLDGPDKGEAVPAQAVFVEREHGKQNICPTCGGRNKAWETDRAYTCECRLIRIDGDPDEITQEETDDCTA